MFIIEHLKDDQRWISGIFNNENDANHYKRKIPLNLIDSICIRVLEVDFPFYLSEDEGFDAVNLEELARWLNRLETKKDIEYIHFNIYLIEDDFASAEPGLDSMGVLKHVHVTDLLLRQFKFRGIELLKGIGMVIE